MWAAIAVSALVVAACAYAIRLGLAGGFAGFGYTYLFVPARLARLRASFESLGDTDAERCDALERLLETAHQKRIVECNERARRAMRNARPS
jgi:hypothetical protein